MDKIVNIKERLESREQQRQLKQDQGKIYAIQKVAQCSSCRLRCAMCGQYLDDKDRSHDTDSSGQEYTFCDNCREEFEDFISSSKGKKHHRVFWHNKEWKEMWSAWLNYKQAIADFINSREFKLLLEELDNQS